ncbi:restriction endonuclease subunit S [Pseudodesulfovibrio sp.]|uniref:restriction endonuclease subunit S n=1 Tax=unclassified Pseudodesulfovibrio TaxID=2661612 RepID=UPI003AFFBB00
MAVREGFKQTEIGEIPTDWMISTIGKSFKLINGRAFAPNDWGDQGLPIIRIQNLNDPDSQFNYYAKPVEDKHKIEAGDLLFAWSGTKGTSFGARIWNGPTGVLNQHIFKVIPDLKRFIPAYAYLVLHRVQEEIEKHAHGFKASFVHVKKSDLTKIILPLPPTKVEQEAIAEALSDADGLIESLEQLIAKKRQIKQGAMQELLTPKSDWLVKKLDNVADVIDPHPSHRAPAAVTNGIPFLGIGDLDEDGNIVGTDARLVPPSVYDEHLTRYDLKEELIGLGRVASIGKVVRLKLMTGKYTISPTLGIIRARNVARMFLLYSLKSAFITDQFKKMLSGSTRSSVGMVVLRQLDIAMPKSSGEQVCIATTLSDMDAEIAELEAKLSKAKKLKQGMMQKLLTGRIRLV